MEWLTEYFDVLLPVALVLLFLFQRLFVRDEEGGPPPAGGAEVEEEARRVQEEIRRKIIARQQGRTEEEGPVAYEQPRQQRPATFPRRQEQPAPLDLERPRPVERPRPRTIPRPEPAAPAAPKRDIQEELRLQQVRLREAREAKAAALRRTSGKAAGKPRRIVVARPAAKDHRGQLLADLATGDSMKRAFLLKEIVDRPVGLRDRPDVFSNWG